MNKIKRWYYELTEKQITRIATIMAIIGILLGVINFFITYSLGRLPKGQNLIEYIGSLLIFPPFLALVFYMVLWFLPSKQAYMCKKKHDEIIPRVKGRFGLGPEFKEVLYSPKETDYDFINFFKILNELEVKYFAEEINGVILISVRSKDGKELELHKIENYNFFDLNFKPKE